MIRVETARLVLRTPGPDDLAAYLAYRNDPNSMETQQMAARDEADALRFLRDQAALPEEASGWRMLGIEEKQQPSKDIVGEVGVFLEPDRAWEGNVGWWLHPRARGRGIATEAARGLLEWCFTVRGLHRVTASCLAKNTGSFAVMQRLKMRVETRTVESKRLGEEWLDEVGCALLRREWRNR